MGGDAEPPKADRIAVLGIAYHNIGVEQEFLKKFDQSLSSYRKGVEVSERYLGPDHSITVTLRNSCVAARRAIVAKDPKARSQLQDSKQRKQKGSGCVRPVDVISQIKCGSEAEGEWGGGYGDQQGQG